MREKPNNRFHSTFRPIPEGDNVDNETDILTHQLIESLSEKIEEMNEFISQTHSLLNTAKLSENNDFRSFSNSTNTSSTTCSMTNSTCSDDTNSNNTNPNSSDKGSSTNNYSSNSNRESKNERVQSPTGNNVGGNVGGTAGSQLISADVILMGSSNYQYTSGDSSSHNYKYGFTDSEFFAFIASLDPIEYILVITVIAIIIATQLNVNERQLLGGALIDIGVTIGNIVEQEFFQRARKNEIVTRQRHEALQCDIENIYRSLVLLQDEINELNGQLNPD